MRVPLVRVSARPGGDAAQLARAMKEGKLHLGVYHGFEFAWARQANPDLKPLVIAVCHHKQLHAYLVVNKEGSIAKRRSYAELISYLTPPIENAGLYKELAGLKDLVMAYRQSTNETEKVRLYESIQTLSQEVHF